MQIKIKSVRIIKEGERKDQTPYKWLSVVADDGSEKGTEYTTFDQKALSLGPGSEIDIGDPKTKDNKLSFTKVVKVITEVPPSEIPQSNAKYHNGEYDQDRIDARTALMQAVEFHKYTEGETITEDVVLHTASTFYDALQTKFDGYRSPDTVAINPEPEKQQSYIADLEKLEFDNPGKLYYNADKYFNYKKPKVDEITVGLDLNNATDRKEAWRRIINEYACSVK